MSNFWNSSSPRPVCENANPLQRTRSHTVKTLVIKNKTVHKVKVKPEVNISYSCCQLSHDCPLPLQAPTSLQSQIRPQCSPFFPFFFVFGGFHGQLSLPLYLKEKIDPLLSPPLVSARSSWHVIEVNNAILHLHLSTGKI